MKGSNIKKNRFKYGKDLRAFNGLSHASVTSNKMKPFFAQTNNHNRKCLSKQKMICN